MKIEVNKLLLIISLFSIHFIPFAYYFNFETMPFLLFLFSLAVLIKSRENINTLLKKDYIIVLLIFFLTYSFLFDVLTFNLNVVEFIKYLIGPIIFFSFPKIYKYFKLNYLFIFIIFIFSLYIIFKFKIPLLFYSSCIILEFFIARMDCGSENISVPFLIAPEPSYLSLMLCFCLLLLLFLNEKENKNKKIIFFFEILLLIIILETKSRIGFIFVLIYFFRYFFLISKKYYYVFFILIAFIFFYLSSFEQKIIGNEANRFLSFQNKNQQNFIIASRNLLNIDQILYAAHNTNRYNLLEIISQKEPTGFIRLLHNYLSIKAFYLNPWGHGIGSYPKNWYNYAQQNNLEMMLRKNEVTMEWFNSNIFKKKQYVQNYFFSILHDFGLIVSIIFLVIFAKSCLNVFRKKKISYYLMLFYLIICFFFQSPITSPYPWIIMAMLFYNDVKFSYLI